jgi:hypothetical protein
MSRHPSFLFKHLFETTKQDVWKLSISEDSRIYSLIHRYQTKPRNMSKNTWVFEMVAFKFQINEDLRGQLWVPWPHTWYPIKSHLAIVSTSTASTDLGIYLMVIHDQTWMVSLIILYNTTKLYIDICIIAVIHLRRAYKIQINMNNMHGFPESPPQHRHLGSSHRLLTPGGVGMLL